MRCGLRVTDQSALSVSSNSMLGRLGFEIVSMATIEKDSSDILLEEAHELACFGQALRIASRFREAFEARRARKIIGANCPSQ
jgi:hypothetical protein